MIRRSNSQMRRLKFERLEDRSPLAGDVMGWSDSQLVLARVDPSRPDDSSYQQQVRTDQFFAALGEGCELLGEE